MEKLKADTGNIVSLKQKLKPTLKEILKADKDVRDFYRLVQQFSLREKALELLEHKIVSQIR